MGMKTGIQWCDSTVNPTTGCDGCELWQVLGETRRKSCYAGILHETRLSKSMPDLYDADFAKVRQAPGRMAQAARWGDLRGKARPDKPWLDGQPRIIFLSDMSDAMSAAVSFDYLNFEIITNVTSQAGSRHIWLWLTKQPNRMASFCTRLQNLGIEWPRNLWAGTSITSQATTGRIKQLLQVGDDFTTRFLSIEPLHQPIDVELAIALIDWMIIGGESGPGARPCDITNVRSLIGQGQRTGTSVFVKQLGAAPVEWELCGIAPGSIPDSVMDYHLAMGGSEPDDKPHWLDLEDSHGGDWSEWPEDLRVRQMPAGKEVAR